MIARILGTSRYLIVIAVIGSFMASATLIIYGGLAVVFIALGTLGKGVPNSADAKTLIVSFIEMIDLFLLGIVLYVISAGLYKLFIGPIDLPGWLQLRSLDELKAQLIGVIIVLMAVIFLGQVVATKDGGLNILSLGIGISLVIWALVQTLRHSHPPSHPPSHNDHPVDTHKQHDDAG